MDKTCTGCTDRSKFFRAPPCATCKHEVANDGTEDNFRPYIEQEAAYKLLAVAEWIRDQMEPRDQHRIWAEISRCDGAYEWHVGLDDAIANAKGADDA